MKIFEKESKLLGWSYTNFAIKLGISQSAIHAWLDERAKPKPENVKKLLDLGFSETACLDPTKSVEV